jgi:predicted oxidoreductase
MSRRGKHDIAPIIRNGWMEGVTIVARRRGMTVPELFAEWIEADPIAVLNAVARYTVREKSVSGKVEHEHRHTHEPISDTAGWIEGVLGEIEEGKITKSLPNGSLLPAAVRIAEAGR